MPTLVPALSGRGIAYRNAQKYDLSLHDFDQAIAIEPNNAGLYKFARRQLPDEWR